MTNRKSTTGFPASYRRSAYVAPKSPKGWLKNQFFQFFGIKFNFSQIKSATKIRCVKTSSGKVVEQSISYEITEKYRRESVSFHLKYWKLTYAVVALNVHANHDHGGLTGSLITTALSQRWWMTLRLKCSVYNCTVNFTDVGTAHCSRTVSLR